MFHYFVEDIRKAIACICCLVILGPLLFVIGIWQFASAPTDHQRENNINSMNNAVSTWVSQYQKPFAAESFSIQSVVTQNYVTMLQTHTQDIKDTSINTYTPVQFTTSQTILPSKTWKSELLQTFTYTVSGNTTGAFVVTVPLFSTYQNSDSSSLCSSNGGDYYQGTCTYYYVLNGLCVKVSVQQNRYVADNTYGNVGCYYQNGYPADVGEFYPGLYIQVPYSRIGQTFSFQGTSFTVRHADDPYIYGQYLSQGTMSWGLTPTQKIFVGLALMAIGGFFMLPCIIFVVVLAVCCRRKHYHHHYDVIH